MTRRPRPGPRQAALPMFGQVPDLDLDQGRQLRDAALDQVDEAAEEEWKEEAIRAVRQCAVHHFEFTTDQVWEYMDRKPLEPRAMGPVMLRAHDEGLIEKTDRFMATAQPSGHAGPRRIWRSKLRV